GEMQGLKTYGALEKKRQYEAEFTRRIQQNPDLNYRYGNLLPRLNALHQEIEPYALARDYYLEVFVRNSEIMSLAGRLDKWAKSYSPENPSAFIKGAAEQRGALEAFYKDYRPAVDQAVLAALLELFAEKAPGPGGADAVKTIGEAHGGYAGAAAHIFANSAPANKDRMLALLEQEPAVVVESLNNDPALILWRAVTAAYQRTVEPKYTELQPQINLLQRQYMAAQMVVFREKRFFPDANSTLRLTYGQVRGYSPRDAVVYDYRTYLDGVVEKYVPGDYEFDVPAKLLELWKNKDFGPYTDKTGRVPVAFLGSNHTTGGNSGSPALDANGHLIGLNFDRVWEGTMSDLNYDPAICRNIMVDIRYVLFVVDKFAGAQPLVKEMNLVLVQKSKKT
ncbi:MAG: S46 family peptidase, partial [Saprospiraceae bacterium]